MSLVAKVIVLSLMCTVSTSLYGEPPVRQLQPGMRAIVLKVQDDFAERPGTLIDIYVVAHTTSRRSRTAIVLEKGVYTNIETVDEPETVLLSRVPVLSASDVPRGNAVVGVDEVEARRLQLLSQEYGDKLRARVAK